MKRNISIIAFAALMLLGLVVVNSSLDAISGTSCLCFDEIAAWELCEGLCAANGHGVCIQTVETSSYCVGTTCYFDFWIYCQDGTQYRRNVSSAGCPFCEG